MIPGPGRSRGGGSGNPLLYSCHENSMDRGAWRAATQGVAKNSDVTESNDVAWTLPVRALSLHSRHLISQPCLLLVHLRTTLPSLAPGLPSLLLGLASSSPTAAPSTVSSPLPFLPPLPLSLPPRTCCNHIDKYLSSQPRRQGANQPNKSAHFKTRCLTAGSSDWGSGVRVCTCVHTLHVLTHQLTGQFLPGCTLAQDGPAEPGQLGTTPASCCSAPGLCRGLSKHTPGPCLLCFCSWRRPLAPGTCGLFRMPAWRQETSLASARLQDPDSSQRARGRAVLPELAAGAMFGAGPAPLEKASHLGLGLRKDPRAKPASRVPSYGVRMRTSPRPSGSGSQAQPASDSREPRSRDPSRGSPPPPAVHGEAVQGRPLPSARIPYFLSATTVGGRLAALLGAELTGFCVGHSLGAGPSRGGERPGKDPEGQVPAHLLLPIPGWGRGPGGTKSRDCHPMCPRPPWLVPVALCDRPVVTFIHSSGRTVNVRVALGVPRWVRGLG